MSTRIPADSDDEPWYADGLNFECHWPRCKACCTGEPGFVWVTPDEARQLADHLELTLEAFLSKHCVEIDNRMSLIDSGDDTHDCTFLGAAGCNVYEHRPGQCRAYPFWPELLLSRATWDDEAEYCPGINHGRLVLREEIDTRREQKSAKRPFWFEGRVIQDVRAELMAAVRENMAQRRSAEPAAGAPRSALDDTHLPLTDDTDDDDTGTN